MATMFQSMTQAAQSIQPMGLLDTASRRTSEPGLRSAGGTVLGGLASLAKGNAEATQQEIASINDEMDAGREELAGRNDVLNLTRSLNDDLAQIFAASGASGSGSGAGFQASVKEAFEVGNDNIENSQFQTNQRSDAFRANARQRRYDGKQSKLAGRLEAGFQGIDFFDRKRRRG